MHLHWQIKEATIQDAPQLQYCMESAYTSYTDRIQKEMLPPLNVDYLEEIKNFPTWIVHSQDKILAGLIMTFEPNKASIANIAVSPKYQGNGIGGKLIKFSEQQAKKRGFSCLYLATHTHLHENISLYKYLGWEEISRNNTKVEMKKEL